MWGRQSQRVGFFQVLPRCGLAGREQNLCRAKITAATKVDLLSPGAPSFPSSRSHGLCRLPANSASGGADSEGNTNEGRGEKCSLPARIVASPLPWPLRSASDPSLLLAHQIILFPVRVEAAGPARGGGVGPAGCPRLAAAVPKAKCRMHVGILASVRVPEPPRWSRGQRLSAASVP